VAFGIIVFQAQPSILFHLACPDCKGSGMMDLFQAQPSILFHLAFNTMVHNVISFMGLKLNRASSAI
jgi:hypothetical protein